MTLLSFTFLRLVRCLSLPAPALLIVSLLACGQNSQPGSQKRMRVEVGQIKEITLPAPADSTIQLIGTSDNSEVVDVSPKQLADELATTKPGNAVFLIKGVTVGTVKVVFSTKPLNQTGSGQPIRTYVVQVSAK